VPEQLADLPVDALRTWVRTWTSPAASIDRVRRLAGHSGETLAFDVTTAEGCTGYVARLAPPGVPRSGSTDVLRQVPLLELLHRAALPVAEVVAWARDDPGLGTDVIAQRRIDGRPLHMFDAAASVPTPDDAEPHLRQAVEALASIHRVRIGDWAEPRSVTDEVGTWTRLLPRLPEQAWTDRAAALADELLRSDPGNHVIGLVHGDYQTNNLLYGDDGKLLAVVDWELAGVGTVGLDAGWLAMMLDPHCWGPPLREQLLVRAAPSQIRAWYEEVTGTPLAGFDWYLALACFRYGVIGAYNVRLHRTGRRPDEFNAEMPATVSLLLDRGLQILAG